MTAATPSLPELFAEVTETANRERRRAEIYEHALAAIRDGRWAVGMPDYTGSGVRRFARDVLTGRWLPQ